MALKIEELLKTDYKESATRVKQAVENYNARKIAEAEAKQRKIEANIRMYHVGCHVNHGKFGRGVVTEILEDKGHMVIRFESGEKKFSLKTADSFVEVTGKKSAA